MRVDSDDLLKKWDRLLLLSAALECESNLIFRIGRRRIECQGSLQNGDSVRIFAVGNQRLREINLGRGALRGKLGRCSQLLYSFCDSLLHHERQAEMQMCFRKVWV